MNRFRLLAQELLGIIARWLDFNDRLSQFCDRCGRSGAGWPSWWADTPLWESVAGNVNGHHHGCYCPSCFDELARAKGILLLWKPELNA
jgi:hypothetical protein